MSSEEWFYVARGSQQGPVSLDELKQKKQDGSLTDSDLVWKEGFGEWLESKDVAELGAGGAATPAPEAPKEPDASAAFGAPSSSSGAVETGGAVETAPAPVASSPVASPSASPVVAAGTTAATAVVGGGSGGEVTYAGFWRRFAAYLIDLIILMIVIGPISILVGGMPTVTPEGEVIQSGMPALAGLLSHGIFWLYYALLESSGKQASIGKMALGIVVTDLDGAKISFLRATGRHFAKYISSIILLVGFIMAGFTARKQALHDMIASTLVVKK